MQVLRVLDPPAQRLAGVRAPLRLERLLEDVQRLAVASITDRVDAELIAVLEREACGLADLVYRRRVEPVLSGLSVRHEEPRRDGAPSMAFLIARTVRTVAIDGLMFARFWAAPGCPRTASL